MIRLGMMMSSGVALAAPGLFVRVHANGNESADHDQKKLRPSEFPIYEDPELEEYETIPETESTFRLYISSARKWTWHYLESVQSTTNKVKDKWDVAKAHTQDTLAYIREDSAVIPRATIITVAGLGGVVAGYKGGLIRKAVYASVGMTTAAAICYPHEAEEITKRGWKVVRGFANDTYEESFGGSKEKKVEVKKPKVEEEAKEEDKPQPSPCTDDSSIKMDFGMSKPEDKDMYTNRGN